LVRGHDLHDDRASSGWQRRGAGASSAPVSQSRSRNAPQHASSLRSLGSEGAHRALVKGLQHQTPPQFAAPRIRFHDLRHTSASLLLAAGVHPKVVQERLGHSQIAITMDTYSHVMPTLGAEAAGKLDAVLAG